MSKFVGPRSLIIFQQLGKCDTESLAWLREEDPDLWELDPNFERFRDFITAMESVNDAVER